MALPKSEFEKHMLHLDAEIRRLEAEYNMFFAGRLPRPPYRAAHDGGAHDGGRRGGRAAPPVPAPPPRTPTPATNCG